MKIKKILCLVLCLVLCLSLFSGCSNTATSYPLTEEVKTEQEVGAEKIIAAYKSILKNPESLQIHSISCVSINVIQGKLSSMDDYTKKMYLPKYNYFIGHDYLYVIDYSAQNGFGGMNRDKIYVSYKVGEGISSEEYYKDDDYTQYYNTKERIVSLYLNIEEFETINLNNISI